MSNKVQLLVLSGVLLFPLAQMANARVIYGEDNRVEVSEASPFQQKLARSAATMISKENLSRKFFGKFKVSQKATLRAYLERATSQGLPVCRGERFVDQPTPGSCSGFLIAPDLVVTAGHCMDDESACASNSWVFDFKVDPQSNKAGTSIKKEDVYNCKKVVSNFLNAATNLDYAVVQLDRPVKGREPLEINNQDKVKNFTKLVIIGSPSGLPLKVADGASVRDNEHPHFFNANLDSFQGNSGSGVFNAQTGAVEGILVRGEQDFSLNYLNRCIQTYKCSDIGCRGEDVTRITAIPEVGIQNALNQASLSGDVDTLNQLLALKTWVDFYTKDGQSALMKAAQGGHKATVEALLKAGAEVNLQDSEGNSSLHHLARILNETSKDTLDLLIQKGANLELKNSLGETALNVAAKNSNTAGVELLVQKGAIK